MSRLARFTLATTVATLFQVVFGALGRDVLTEKIAAARACIVDASC